MNGLKFFLNLFIRPTHAFRQLAEKQTRWTWLFVLAAILSNILLVLALQHSKSLAVGVGFVMEDPTAAMGGTQPGMIMGEGAVMPGENPSQLGITESPLVMVWRWANALLAPLVLTFLWTSLLHTSTVLAGGSNTFRQMIGLIHVSWITAIVRNLVQALAMLVTGKVIQAQGLAGLVQNTIVASDFGETPLSMGAQVGRLLLSQIDLYAVWFFVLLVLGTAVMGRVKKRTALLVVVLSFSLLILLKIVPVLVRSAIGI